MTEGFKAGAAYIDVDGDADVAIRKIERQIKNAGGRLSTVASRIGSNMGAKIGSNIERQLKASQGRLGVAADGIGTRISGKINSAISKGLGGKIDTSIGKRATQVGQAVGSALGDGIDDGASRSIGSSGGPKTKKALDSVAERTQAQFQGLVFAGAFGGLPIAAAGASALTIGALAAIPIAAVAGAATLQSGNERVEKSYTRLADTAMGVMKRASSVLVDDLVDGTDKLEVATRKLEPAITSVFRNSAPAVDGVVTAVTSLANEAMPGVLTASTKTGAAMTGLVSIATGAGRGISDFFTNVSKGAESSAKNGAILGRVIQDLLGFAGSLVSNLASNTGALNSFANVMTTVYSTVLNLTQAGGALTGFVGGFTAVVSGALSVVNGLSTGLGGVLAPLLAMGGAFKALDMLTFGKLTANLGTQFAGLGTSIGAANGARAKFATGMAGLGRAVMSPVGLATMGLVAGLALLGMAQQRAAQAAADHKARVQDLASALRESNGAINDNVRSAAAKSLADAKMETSGKGFLDTARQLGVNLPQLTDAYLGNDAAGRKIVDTLKAQIAEGEKYASSRAEADALQEKKAMAADLIATMGNVNGAYALAVQANKDLAAASGTSASAMDTMSPALAAAQQGVGKLASAYTTLYTPMSSAADKGAALVAILDRITGRTPSFEEAIQSTNDVLRGMADAFSQGMDTTKGWGQELINADGTVNTMTENGSNLQNQLVSIQGGFANAAGSIQELVEGGMTYNSASEKVRAELQRQRDAFIAIQTPILGSKAAAEALANTYGLLPDEAVTKVTDHGSAIITQTDVNNLLLKVKELPPNTPVRVTSITAEAEQKLKDLGYTVTHMPDGTVLIFANNRQALAGAAEVESRVQAIQDRSVYINVVATGVAQAAAAVAGIAARASAAVNHDGGFTKTVGHKHLRHRATGGPTPFIAGLEGAAVYGERGVEVGFPGRSEYVSTALQTARMERGASAMAEAIRTLPSGRSESGGGTTINLTVDVHPTPSMDVDAFTTKIIRKIQQRLNGGS